MKNCPLPSTIFRMPYGHLYRWKHVIWVQNLNSFYIWTHIYKYSFNPDFFRKIDTCISWGKIGTLSRLFGTLSRSVCHFGKSWHRWPHLNLNHTTHLWQPAFVAAVFIETLYVGESIWLLQYDHFTKFFGRGLPKHLNIKIYIIKIKNKCNTEKCTNPKCKLNEFSWSEHTH